MPALDEPWTPPSLIAGDLDGLAAALASTPAIGLHLGPRLQEPGRQRRLAAALAALAPTTSFAPPSAGTITDAIDGLALERAGVGEHGRPRYTPRGRARDEWRGDPRGPTLVVDDAPIEGPRWSALQAHAIGGCEAPRRALAEGQELSLAEIEPFLDHADAALDRAYRGALQRSLPALRREFAGDAVLRQPGEFASAIDFRAHQCGHVYHEYLAPYVACAEGRTRCPLSPRLLLVDGAQIGAREPPLPDDEGCPALIGREPIGELRRTGRDAVRDAAQALDLEWSVLADRLGLLGEVVAVLEDICAPRRRRFVDADVDEARRRLTAIGEALRAADHSPRDGGWAIADGEIEAPGIGAIRTFARFDPGRGSINLEILAGARGLREWVLGRSRCRGRREQPPLAAALVDARGEVSFLGYFYEEELVCDDLPSLTGDARPVGAL